jgi:Mg-chelatase subunit ChlD
MLPEARLEEMIRWAHQIGQELLGKPVRVSLSDAGLGQTRESLKRQAVEIVISPAPITNGHPHGADIMRGLVLHEIGHHLADFGARGHKTTRGIARSEGIGDIYDILCDERLERRLRSRRPQWGVYFDRLASYAFAQNDHEVPLDEYAAVLQRAPHEVLTAIQSRILPGRFVPLRQTDGQSTVALRDIDLLGLPGVVPPLAAFLTCLRCGVHPQHYPDARVAEAVALVPRNLKDLSHAALLQLARKIATLLGRSDQQRNDMEQLRQRMRAFPNALRGLETMLDRLERTNRLSDSLRSEWPDSPRSRRRHDRRPRAAVRGQHPTSSSSGHGGPNLNPEMDFPPLVKEETIPYDPVRHADLVNTIRLHIRRLRAYLTQLGKQTVEEFGSRRGTRLDVLQARKIPSTPTPNLLVFPREEIQPDAYIGMVIDRSGSMRGERLDRAKAFGALVAESAKGVRGIDGHINAFDGDTWYWLGNFQRTAIASLTADGGNNDAGALARAAELAVRSHKRNKLLLMISDAVPAQCTFASLKNVVTRLTRDHGILCAQVAVAEIEEIAFPHSVDLSQYPFDEAVTRFGKLLMKLTAPWR